MNLKRFNLKLILVFILSALTFEVVLRIQRGLPPLEPYVPDFRYQYEEIYKRFFRKVRLSNGDVVYKTQRYRAQEQSFSVCKIKGTKRIFLLGGSVAQILSKSSGIYLKELLEELIPWEKFEVIGCGMGAYDSYRVSLIHKEILNYNPDFIILLCGNNEYYVPVQVNLWAYRLNRLFCNLWIYQELQKKFLACIKNRWKYNEIPYGNRLKNYENNLRIMIRRAKKRRIPMVLCTLPANFRDCPPAGIPVWKDKLFFLA